VNISGISSYVNDPSDAGPSLNILIKNAKRNVPRDKWSSTPVYLGATAGMRLLR
jgi:Golgi nucleoside diphosphatase